MPALPMEENKSPLIIYEVGLPLNFNSGWGEVGWGGVGGHFLHLHSQKISPPGTKEEQRVIF